MIAKTMDAIDCELGRLIGKLEKAVLAYLEAIDPQTSVERQEYLQQRLLVYCKYDTLAMVRLVEFLRQGPN